MPEPTDAQVDSIFNLATNAPTVASISALDSIFESTTGSKPGDETPESLADAEEKAVAKAAADKSAADKVEADRIAAEKAKAEPTPEEKAAKEKADADKLAADKEAANKAKTPDVFDGVELPPLVRPKTGASFEKLKTLAREQVAARETALQAEVAKRTELEAKVKEYEAKLADPNKLPDAVAKELEELRQLRKTVEIDADPVFKDFSNRQERNNEIIVEQLLSAGYTKENIDEAKKIGLNRLNWEPILAELPPMTRRLVEARLGDNESLRVDEKRARADAKSRADSFLADRQKAQEAALGGNVEKVIAERDNLVKQFEFLKPKSAATDAKPEEKAAVEAHNKFVTETKAAMEELTKDNSPEMRGTLIAAYASFLHGKAQLKAMEVAAKSVADKHAEAVKGYEKQIADVTAELTKIKASSTGRLRGLQDAGRPAGGVIPTRISARPEAAIDALRDEVAPGVV